MKFIPITVYGIKCTVGHFFLFKIKFFVLKMVTNWLLTFRFMNATWLDWKLTLCLTSESFLSFSAWFWDCFKLDCIYIQILPCCLRCNWMVIMQCYLERAALRCKLASHLEALIVLEQLSSFNPCHYLLLLIKKVNKLKTNSETRDNK